MKNKLLIFVFATVSIIITGQYTFYFGLQTSLLMAGVFLVFGAACDFNKSMMPKAIIENFQCGNYFKGTSLTLIYLLLVSFSFYCSYASLELAEINKIKAGEAYQALELEKKGYQTSYDKLVAIDRITKANTEYLPKIKTVTGKQLELLKAKKEISLEDLIKNLAFALLIEVSILGVHLSSSRPNRQTQRQTATRQDQDSDKTQTALAGLEARLLDTVEDKQSFVSQTSLKKQGLSLSGTRFTELMIYLKRQGKVKKVGKKWQLNYPKENILSIVNQ